MSERRPCQRARRAMGPARWRSLLGAAVLLAFAGYPVWGQAPGVLRPPGGRGLPLAAPAGAEAAEDGLRLKFRNNPLDLVLKDYAEKTLRTMLQAPNLPNVNITLESQTDLTLNEYLDAIETVLAMNGIALLKVGDKFLKVVPIAQARQEAMAISEIAEGTPLKESDALVSEMIALKHIDTAEAVKAITPLKHAYGQIHTFERSNSILVTDASATLNRLVQILKLIDQPVESLEEPNIIQIQFAKASDIKKKLEEIIAESQKQQQKSSVPRPKDAGSPGVVTLRPPTPAGVIRAPVAIPVATAGAGDEGSPEIERGIIRGEVRMVADERTNLLIIITRRENMSFFEKIIKVLDVETAPDVMVKVIRLEYADCEAVAGSLNTLIGQVSKGPDVKLPAAQAGAGDQPRESAALREYVERIAKERSETQVEKGKSKVGELAAENIKILPDKRTNSLLIMASKGDMAALEEMITGMDIMLSQVLIEVVVFKITLNNSYERGIDWVQRAMVTYNEKSGSAQNAFAGAAGGDKYRGSMKDPLSLTTLPSLSSAAGNLSYYFTFFDVNLDMIVKLMASDNRTQIMSTPTILTTDNTKATISVKKEKYFFRGLKPITAANGEVDWVDDVERSSIETMLSVTPRINQKKFVVLEINQKLQEEGASQTIKGSGGSSAWPTIDSADMTASVAVRSGETVVLGGLVSNQRVQNKSKVPFLGDIPILGVLFGYTFKDLQRSEILVFITPYVVDTPEDIEAETLRRRAGMSMRTPWPDGSASKLREPDERDQGDKARDGTPTMLKGTQPAAAVVTGNTPVESVEIDPALEEFIKRQEGRWEKALKNADRQVDKSLQETPR